LRLKHVLEAVNAVLGELFASDFMLKKETEVTLKKPPDEDAENDEVYDWSTGDSKIKKLCPRKKFQQKISL